MQPQPRAVLQVVDPEEPHGVTEYGETGRVMLTTLTKEFFVPRFLDARRGRARAALRSLSRGTGSAASVRSVSWQPVRRLVCTETPNALGVPAVGFTMALLQGEGIRRMSEISKTFVADATLGWRRR